MHHHINQPRKRVDLVERGGEGGNVCKKITMGKQGINPKMLDPQCIKTYYQTTMMPEVPQSMGLAGCPYLPRPPDRAQ